MMRLVAGNTVNLLAVGRESGPRGRGGEPDPIGACPRSLIERRNLMDDSYKLQALVVEAILAWEEHQTSMLIGGHDPVRVAKAMQTLRDEIVAQRNPQAGNADVSVSLQ
jgi:hypothetical protein